MSRRARIVAGSDGLLICVTIDCTIVKPIPNPCAFVVTTSEQDLGLGSFERTGVIGTVSLASLIAQSRPGSSGNVKTKVAPWGEDSAHARPPCASTIPRAM